VLLFFDAPMQLTLRDVVSMMIDFSDNTATNLLIDRFGIQKINSDTASIGLANTYLYKKVFKQAVGDLPPDYEKFGLGKTTAREMARLMLRIGHCTLEQGNVTESDRTLCREAITILSHQFYRDSIPRYLEKLDSDPDGTAIINKSGALDAVRNDVGILATKHGAIVISAFTYDNKDHSWTADNSGELCIGRMSKMVAQAWATDGLSVKALQDLPRTK
jgi:beta-lactamase class A